MHLWNIRPFFLFALLFRSAIASSGVNAVDDVLTTRECDGSSSPSSDFGRIQRQNAIIEERLAQQKIGGVRKMSDDEGEKFFFDYWIFNDDVEVYNLGNISVAPRRGSDDSVWSNASVPMQFRPAFPLHTDEQAELFRLAERYSGPARRALSMLMKRDFKCPTGTFSCTSINQPDFCCSDGDTCQLIQDTGLGNVGCCPQGETCSGGISSCGSGYTSCPSSLGGGCCIPGYECVSGGCAFVSTYTVTEYSTTLIISSTVTTPALPSTTFTSSTSSTSTTSTTKASTSPSLTPPVRPTTESQTITTITSAASVCPTGFYACSAVYQGGCCRIGRDCDTTSCPVTSSTTVLNSDGVTVVVPVPTASTATGGSCASGWFSCAATVGGGCCPSGFACGSSSCTAFASVTATATVAKSQPGNGSGRNKMDLKYCLGACVLGALLFLL
ncbi:hypothetical protein VTN77DRAFT_7086 [Rasamsonia byssochlamydoides]|uniref:uncharacterized protein n=1 Tax=Rasamsonia byssochlamydoides TaxID=89139 RepID=UPI003742C12E